MPVKLPVATANALAWLGASLLATLLLCGCAGPGYYAQAIAGHLELMRARQDLDALVQHDDTDPQLAAQLREAAGLVRYARHQLALPTGDSYASVVITGRDAVTWNVVVAPEFSTQPKTWCFPVAGCVPYRGYFDAHRAGAFAARMANKNLDVMVSPAIAYSTLGWFDDPLLDTMLQYDAAQLAGIIFHELAHQRLYVRGDTAFNEGFASFVEETGVGQWLTETGQPDAVIDWRRRQQAASQFNQLLLETRDTLQALYASNLSAESTRAAKADVFAGMRTTYQGWVEQEWHGTSYFETWMSGPLNNAHLALATSYEGSRCAFKKLFATAGGDLPQFYQLAERQARLGRKLRAQWLGNACTAFASDVDL